VASLSPSRWPHTFCRSCGESLGGKQSIHNILLNIHGHHSHGGLRGGQRKTYLCTLHLLEAGSVKTVAVHALWFESKRPGLESQRRWRVSDLSRQHQGTGHASLQTHLLWRMRLDMVRQRANMSNVQGTDNWRSGLEGWCYFFVCPVVLRKRNHYPHILFWMTKPFEATWPPQSVSQFLPKDRDPVSNR